MIYFFRFLKLIFLFCLVAREKGWYSKERYQPLGCLIFLLCFVLTFVDQNHEDLWDSTFSLLLFCTSEPTSPHSLSENKNNFQFFHVWYMIYIHTHIYIYMYVCMYMSNIVWLVLYVSNDQFDSFFITNKI